MRLQELFLTPLVVREPDTFDEMPAGFSTVFVPTKLETFDETLGKLPVIFVATTLDIIDEMSGQFSAALAVTEKPKYKLFITRTNWLVFVCTVTNISLWLSQPLNRPNAEHIENSQVETQPQIFSFPQRV